MTGKDNHHRINQWFVRGIGIVVTSLFIAVLSLVFFYKDYPFDQIIISLGVDSESGMSVFLEIGKVMWTFRIYDLLLIVVILVVGLISVYYLMSFKALIKAPRGEQRRRNYL